MTTRRRRPLGRTRIGFVRDERGSLPLALLIVVIGIAVAGILLPLVITQANTTTFDNRRTTTLHAAEAGVDAALGMIRSATDTDGSGDATKLPCQSVSGTLAGALGGSYSVTIRYYTQDPSSHTGDSTWLTANAMTCVSGYGTYQSSTGTYTPSYALLTATGSDGITGDATRTLQGTYSLQTTNSNIAGGQIRIWPSGSDNYCIDAGSNPTVNQTVSIQLCSTATTIPAQQLWAYNTDLSIQLTSTVGNLTLNSNGNGLCLGTTTTSQAVGNSIVLLKCAKAGSAPTNQEWSIDNSSHFEGAKSDGSDIDNLCINVASQAAGTLLNLQTCSGGTTSTIQTWIPSPSVGAGAAGAGNNQLVNYFQFGRCLDVTNTEVTRLTPLPPPIITGTNDSGGDFLILYPCKQNPNPANVLWNQKFYAHGAVTGSAPYTTQWYTCPSGASNCTSSNWSNGYCLTSPTAIGGFVYVSPCSASNTLQEWTTYQTQDASGNELAYKDKYTMRNSSGWCISLSGTDELYESTYYTAIVATCDGSSEQKWNSLPNLQDPVLENLHETSGGS